MKRTIQKGEGRKGAVRIKGRVKGEEEEEDEKGRKGG